MGSLLKAAVLLGAVAALVFLLPLRGRTLADRYRSAGAPGAFVTRLWAELRGEGTPGHPGKHPGRRSPSSQAGGRTDADPTDADQPDGARTDGERPVEGRPGAGPTERHTDADRQALDRLVGDHLADPPKR